MEYLATIVFERTPAGAVAIKAAGDAVPRQLRTLLLAIDGRSPVSQYVPFLTALAPLSEKFAQLEDMGFARRRAAAPPAPAAPAATPTPATPPADAALAGFGAAAPPPPQPAGRVSEAELRDFARGQLSLAPPPMAPPDNNDFAAQLRALAMHNDIIDMGNSAPTPIAPSPPTSAAPHRPVLADLLAEMQAYLSHAAGMEGLPVALMLEQITSLAQLRRELPSYTALVASYGGNPAVHISTLTSLLDEAER